MKERESNYEVLMQYKYTVLNPELFKKLNYRMQSRNRPSTNRSHCILVKSSVDLSLIPENSLLSTPMKNDCNVWELHLPKDFKKDVKKLSKRLDAVAYL